MKIGILGGTFDPIHLGHLQLAECALNELNLDFVYFVPSSVSYQKSDVTDSFLRSEMCKLAISENQKFRFSDVDLVRGGNSYTIDTLHDLKKKHPDDKLYFICGYDTLKNIESFKDYNEILKHYTLAVAHRNGITDVEIKACINDLNARYFAQILLLPFKEIDISSTGIRNNFCRDIISVSELIPFEVYKYILLNDLYSKEVILSAAFDSMQKAIRARLKNILNEHRYIHSLGVAYTAASMAIYYDYDVQKAFLTGLLHDCGKYMKGKEYIDYAEAHDLPVTKSERESTELLHSKVGAYIARYEYKIDDEDILNAILFHTTGRPDMTLLEQIIYLADVIEPSRRDIPNLELYRKTAFEDLNKAIVMVTDGCIEHVRNQGFTLDPATVETNAFYKNK